MLMNVHKCVFNKLTLIKIKKKLRKTFIKITQNKVLIKYIS